jgi:hypothetical protein
VKLPEKIKGRNRIRDGAIVLYFKRDHLDYLELAEKFKLTERRILQILSKNHAFIKRDKEWEKEKRIGLLHRRLKESSRRTFLFQDQKDELAIQSELRKEIEGDDEKGRSSERELKVVVIYPPGHTVSQEQNPMSRIKVEMPNADSAQALPSSIPSID